jgi:hypothetical protein
MLSNKGRSSTCDTERLEMELVLADSKDRKSLVFLRYYSYFGLFTASNQKYEGHTLFVE